MKYENENSTESLSSILQDQISNKNKYGTLSRNIKHLSYKFDVFEIDVILDENERFIGIEGVKIAKSFIESSKLPNYNGKSSEDLIEELYGEQED